MGSLVAIYVRVSDAVSARSLLAEYPRAYTEPDLPFFAIDNPPCGWHAPEVDLRDLSARLATDVLWLAYQSTSGTFEFRHWVGGNHVRSLVYGSVCDSIWDRVEGEAEAWERAAIIEQQPRPFGLMVIEEDQGAEESWDERAPELGQVYPMPDAMETSRKVAEFYRLPGWCLEAASSFE